MVTETVAPATADSSAAVTTGQSAPVIGGGTAEPRAAQSVSSGATESTAQPEPRMVPEEHLRNLQSIKDRELAQARNQMAQMQDALFELQLQGQALTDDQLEARRQAYYGSRQIQAQADMTKAERAALEGERNSYARMRMLDHYSKEWGVPAEVLAKAQNPTEFFSLAAQHLAQKTRNTKRGTNVDRGGGGGTAPDLSKAYGPRKIAIGLAMRSRR